MSIERAQKSEVHGVTGDADSSAFAAGDRETTKQATNPDTFAPKPKDRKPIVATIVKDDTDNGGPLIIESSDPELQHLELPQDPFPTDGTPEIDPPVEK